MSFNRLVLNDELPGPEWQRLRNMQMRGELPGDGRPRRTPPTDNLSAPAWFGMRDAQVRGLDFASGAALMPAVALQSAPVKEVEGVVVNPRRRAAERQLKPSRPQGPLKGRPGVAAIVAGALNTIAAVPNTSAPLKVAPFDGSVSRGAGRDIRASGKIGGALSVGVEGVLDPPTGRAEISASSLSGKGVRVPSRIRIYTTPTGELDVELPGPAGVGPFRFGKGTYYIGTPDPRKRK
jgi:hypothetical protein